MSDTQTLAQKGYIICRATKEQGENLEIQLNDFNTQTLGFQGQIAELKDYIVKDGDNVIAGIRTCLNFQESLYIRILFISKDYRRQGLGSMLLKFVENGAISSGVKLIHLNTFDFQAKDFYLKCGYEFFATLDYYPQERKLYSLKKIL